MPTSRLLLSSLELKRSLARPHAELRANAHIHLLHIRIALALQAVVRIPRIIMMHLPLVHVRVIFSIACTHQNVTGLVPRVFHLPVSSSKLLLRMCCLGLRILIDDELLVLIGVCEVD